MKPEEIIQWYNERSGLGEIMRKDVGNALWNYLHTLAEWTPPEPARQNRVFEVVKKNVEVFPCQKCAKHGLEYIEKHPFDPEIGLKDYLWEFHNFINNGLGKKVYGRDILKQYSVVDHECEANELIKGCVQEG
jgi:hypothetical protein